jgi:1,4-dihydroxy-2-naphthoate octaprenyltransferase
LGELKKRSKKHQIHSFIILLALSARSGEIKFPGNIMSNYHNDYGDSLEGSDGYDYEDFDSEQDEDSVSYILSLSHKAETKHTSTPNRLILCILHTPFNMYLYLLNGTSIDYK